MILIDIFVINYQLQFPALPTTLAPVFLVKLENSCMQTGANCCPSFENLILKLRISQIMPIIEKEIVIYNDYNFRNPLQLVIIIIIITIFAKVVHNCNAYILNVITTSLTQQSQHICCSPWVRCWHLLLLTQLINVSNTKPFLDMGQVYEIPTAHFRIIVV